MAVATATRPTNRPRLTIPTNAVDVYALRVVNELEPAGRYHRLACLRHLEDRVRRVDDDFPFVFDWDAANDFITTARKFRHYKGQWAGDPIALSDSQVFRLGSIFGWRHVETGLRRFTTAYNELPRKSGKTLEAAVVALYVTFMEHEPGAEGYCIATKREQAKRVFDDAKHLVRVSGLRSRITVQMNNLHRLDQMQKLEPLGADADSTDGLNPYLIITDEYHAHKTRKLVDVMISATGARLSFLHYIITTAGDDPVSPCGEEHDYACRVLDGVLDDNVATQSYFAFIAHADEGDDWLDPTTWRKANPQWGVSVLPEDLKKIALKAKDSPSEAAEFKQKRLNLWVNRSAPSLSIDGWRNGQSDWQLSEMTREPCMAGLDVSAKLDLTSLSLVWAPTEERKSWRVAQWIWTPGETLVARAHRDRAPYRVWVDQRWLIAAPGPSISLRLVQEKLRELRTVFTIHLLGFDPWHMDKLDEDLKADDGWDEESLIEVPQTFAGMTSAESRFKAEVLGANVDARRCPVTAWAVSNVIDATDGKNNIMFSKKHSRGRIDPVKSITIALHCHLRQPIPVTKEYKVLIVG